MRISHFAVRYAPALPVQSQPVVRPERCASGAAVLGSVPLVLRVRRMTAKFITQILVVPSIERSLKHSLTVRILRTRLGRASSSDRSGGEGERDRHALGHSPPLTTQPTTGRNGRETGASYCCCGSLGFARASASHAAPELAGDVLSTGCQWRSENVNTEFADGGSGVWRALLQSYQAQALPSHHTAWESMHTPMHARHPRSASISAGDLLDVLRISRGASRPGRHPCPCCPRCRQVCARSAGSINTRMGLDHHGRGRRFFVVRSAGRAKTLAPSSSLLLELLRELLQVAFALVRTRNLSACTADPATLPAAAFANWNSLHACCRSRTKTEPSSKPTTKAGSSCWSDAAAARTAQHSTAVRSADMEIIKAKGRQFDTP